MKPKTFEFDFEEVDPHHRRVPPHGARQRVRHLRDGDHDLYLRQGARQADDRGAGVPGARASTTAPSWSTPRPASARRRTSKARRSASTAATPSPPACGRAASCRTSTASTSPRSPGCCPATSMSPNTSAPAERGADREGQEHGRHARLGRACRPPSASTSNHPDVKPLIPNALEAGLQALRERGHYPINHCVVIKDELIAKYPDLAADVFNAFAESKRLYVERAQGRPDREADRRSTRCISG